MHCVLHADLLHDSALVTHVLSRRFRPYIHVAGYRVVDLQQLDASTTRTLLALNDEHPWGEAPALQGACWEVLEREPEYTDDHGPPRLAFLHVQCEAVWLYWNLWARSCECAPYAILLQDHGYAGTGQPSAPAARSMVWRGRAACGQNGFCRLTDQPGLAIGRSVLQPQHANSRCHRRCRWVTRASRLLASSTLRTATARSREQLGLNRRRPTNGSLLEHP